MKKRLLSIDFRFKTLFLIIAFLLIFLSGCGDGDGDGDGDDEYPYNEPPFAAFTVDTTSGLVPLTVNFDATDSNDPDGEIVSFAWNFGDGNSGSGAAVSHVYTRPGMYTAWLTVTDDGGKAAGNAFAVIMTHRILWSFTADRPVYYSSPAVADDGTIYFADGMYTNPAVPATQGGSVYALDPDGTLKWTCELEGNGFSPVIGADGTIYIQDRSSILYAIDPVDGSMKWIYDKNLMGSEVGHRTPAVGIDGTIYIAGFDLHAVNPDGTQKWVADTSLISVSPAVDIPGNIYVVHGGGRSLLKIDSSGNRVWTFIIEHPGEAFNCFSAPSIDGLGVVYFAAEIERPQYGSYLYAVNPDGTLRWRYFVQGCEIRSSPAIGGIGGDRTVYIGTKAGARPGALIALNPDGTLKWEFLVEKVHFTPDDVYSSPTIGKDGTIYFGAETGFLHALRQDGTLLWKQELENGINWSSAAIVEDGTLYIGTIASDWAGRLYALKTESLGLAVSAPWPKFHHDNKNTGRKP